jgi:hypothetical protein
MREDDGCHLVIRDGTPADLEDLLTRARPSGTAWVPGERPVAEDEPAPLSEAARIFGECLDRRPPR